VAPETKQGSDGGGCIALSLILLVVGLIVLTALHDVTRQLEHAMLAAGLPQEPDRTAVNALLIDAYRNHWAANR
jgi:hypothetical protein